MVVSLSITGLYTSLLALLFVGLAINIIRLRLHFKAGIGDGGHQPLAKAIRVHGNFAEYIPMVLIMLGIYEVNGASPIVLHALGAILFIGRILHAVGLSKTTGVSKQRQLGMLSLFLVMLILAVENIRLFITAV
jgi:uncharacterized membrane protein YecN with MAPEG domain